MNCQKCSKKVGIYGFVCKCNSTFCSNHRYPESHNCSFDWKDYERSKLKDTLQVKFEKLPKL